MNNKKKSILSTCAAEINESPCVDPGAKIKLMKEALKCCVGSGINLGLSPRSISRINTVIE